MGSRDKDRLDEGALDAGWLLRFERIKEGIGVFKEFIGAEGNFAEADMDDRLLVYAVLNLAGFGFFDSLLNISSNGAGLWIWHEAFWTKEAGEFTEFWHISWGGDENVEVDGSLFKLF